MFIQLFTTFFFENKIKHNKIQNPFPDFLLFLIAKKLQYYSIQKNSIRLLISKNAY